MVETHWVKPKTVFVTGGTGFVGAYVCRLLVENGQIPIASGLDPFSAEALFMLGDSAKQIDFVQADISDREATLASIKKARPDAIIHAAGYVGHDASLADPARAYDVNVGGTVNVLEAARKTGIQKVVLISSNAAYHKRERDFFDETHPTTSISQGNPNAHYGTSKMAAEQIGLTYFTFHNIDVIVVRITSVYGFGMKAGQMALKQLVEAAVNGQEITIPTGGSVVRDYTYVEETAAGIVDILNMDSRAMQNRVFNISRGELSSTFDIALAIRTIIPTASLAVGSEMTPFEQATLKQRVPLSWNAANKAFGYQSNDSIGDGIKKYIELYRKYRES